MTNDNCRKFKQNQIIFCICARLVKYSRSVDFGEAVLRGRGSLPATVYLQKKVIIIQCVKAVSYTHLDVYKRQAYSPVF